jgi:hypothetical protein
MLKVQIRENKQSLKPIDLLEISNKDYSINNDVAVTGFMDGVGRRPLQHMIAQIIWILKFECKKVTRCAELFVGERDNRNAKA